MKQFQEADEGGGEEDKPISAPLFQLGDNHVFDHTGIDPEALYDLDVFAAADDKAEFAFVGPGQAELFGKVPVVEAMLVELRTVLVPYEEGEKGALGVGVGDVEYDLVILCSYIFDHGGIPCPGGHCFDEALCMGGGCGE